MELRYRTLPWLPTPELPFQRAVPDPNRGGSGHSPTALQLCNSPEVDELERQTGNPAGPILLVRLPGTNRGVAGNNQVDRRQTGHRGASRNRRVTDRPSDTGHRSIGACGSAKKLARRLALQSRPGLEKTIS